MKTERTKKGALLMVLMMVIGLLSPFCMSVKNVQAETKTAFIRNILASPFEWKKNNYVDVIIHDTKDNTLYTVTTSDENIAEGCCCYNNYGGAGYVKVFVKKPGKFTVTVKEHDNGVVTNIGTQTVEMYPYSRETELKHHWIIMESGTSSALENIGTFSKDVKVTSKNTAVVKVKKSAGKTILTANKVGKTTVTIKYSGYNGRKMSEFLDVEVRKKSNSKKDKKARNFAAKVDKYCATPVTAKNAEKLLKGIAALKVKDKNDFVIDGYENLVYYIDKLDEKTGKPVKEKIVRSAVLMIPSKYTYEDLKYVENQCKFALQLDLRSYGVSLEVVSIKKMTNNSITLQLAHPITRKEILAMEGNEKKFPIIVQEDDKYCPRYLTAKVKEGDTEITGTFKVDKNNLAFQKGKTYKVHTYNHTNFTEQTLTEIYE